MLNVKERKIALMQSSPTNMPCQGAKISIKPPRIGARAGVILKTAVFVDSDFVNSCPEKESVSIALDSTIPLEHENP